MRGRDEWWWDDDAHDALHDGDLPAPPGHPYEGRAAVDWSTVPAYEIHRPWPERDVTAASWAWTGGPAWVREGQRVVVTRGHHANRKGTIAKGADGSYYQGYPLSDGGRTVAVRVILDIRHRAGHIGIRLEQARPI